MSRSAPPTRSRTYGVPGSKSSVHAPTSASHGPGSLNTGLLAPVADPAARLPLCDACVHCRWWTVNVPGARDKRMPQLHAPAHGLVRQTSRSITAALPSKSDKKGHFASPMKNDFFC